MPICWRMCVDEPAATRRLFDFIYIPGLVTRKLMFPSTSPWTGSDRDRSCR